MTNQEAIEALIYDKTHIGFGESPCEEAWNIAFSVLEKQISRKPKIKEAWYAGMASGYCKRYYVCPKCECGLRFNKDYHDSYCPNCGIKIDWSDEK